MFININKKTRIRNCDALTQGHSLMYGYATGNMAAAWPPHPILTLHNRYPPLWAKRNIK